MNNHAEMSVILPEWVA